MKTLKEISEKLEIELDNVSTGTNQDDIYWKFYANHSGFYKETYFAITFMEVENWKKIKIAATTDNPSIFIGMIRKIEPKAEITYTKVEAQEVTI